MSRSFRKHCADDHTTQVIYYQAGVGTGTTISDSLTGGAFGAGVPEHIREAYSFICANWDDGDEIVLVGFSRGAFTARSVAGMIGALGLLNRSGMDNFYAIFKDIENARITGYEDEFPERPFGPKVKKPKRGPGSGFEAAYRKLLADVCAHPPLARWQGRLLPWRECRLMNARRTTEYTDTHPRRYDEAAHQGQGGWLLRHGGQPGHPKGVMVAVEGAKRGISRPRFSPASFSRILG